MSLSVPCFATEIGYTLCRPGPVTVRKMTDQELAEIERKYPGQGTKTQIPVDRVPYVGMCAVKMVQDGISKNQTPEEIAQEHNISIKTVRRYMTMHRNGTLKPPMIMQNKEKGR